MARPKGKMTAYACFVKSFCDELKKSSSENLELKDFSKRTSARWKAMTEKEKQKFHAQSEKDKIRYEKEMAAYENEPKTPKKRRDPNAPTLPRDARTIFMKDQRAKLRAEFPSISTDQMNKRLTKLWKNVTAEARNLYQKKSLADKKRYDKEMAVYEAKKGGSKQVEEDESEEEDEEEESMEDAENKSADE